MRRAAFTMRLKPGFESEYRKRHDAIWPELSRALGEAGISDYSIFLDPETLTLFAVQKLSDDNTAHLLPHHPVVRQWWDHMADIMETHPDHTPVCLPLTEVFHMD
jgi:L-rhamnose mutarotase